MKINGKMLVAAVLLSAACTNETGYQLTCEVPEAWEGKTAVLYTADTAVPEALDSAVVKDGKMQMEGSFPASRFCKVIFYLNPADRADRNLTPFFQVFLDSTEVQVVAEPDRSKTKFNVTGTGAMGVWQAYQAETERLYADRQELMTRYIKAFYEDELVREGIDAAGAVDDKAEEILNYRIGLIRENPASMVSIQIFRDILRHPGAHSPEKLEELYGVLTPEIQQTEQGKDLLHRIRSRKIYPGATCPDVELKDFTGRTVDLAGMLPDGNYTLVELWASWCSPCRGEIPFIRRAYEKYHSKGFEVISISIDKDTDAWKKTLEQEKMPWIQLSDQTQLSFKAFETSLVPSSYLVGPDGKIVKMNARGGWLDAALEEIYGK